METIKCCIACILPCGALDVVRIVHSNGRVEEISGGPVLAAEIMKAYPKHVLRKPPSTCPADAAGIVVHKPVVLPPSAELHKGKIYFLMPVMADATPAARAPYNKPPAAKLQPPPPPAVQQTASSAARTRRRRRKDRTTAAREGAPACSSGAGAGAGARTADGLAPEEGDKERLLANERYLSEIMKETASTSRDRRQGRVAVWRPHLDSITEDDL